MVPFNEDLSLNLGALSKNIAYMIDGGMRTGRGHMICPCGTGEYLTLSADEHRRVVETAVEAAAGELPVVAGVAGINLTEVIAMAESAHKAGAKYVMVSPPFYDPIDQDGIFEWSRILNESVGAGIMIYDQSWRTPRPRQFPHRDMDGQRREQPGAGQLVAQKRDWHRGQER